MEFELAYALLSPFAADQPSSYLIDSIRRHAASVESVWIQPGNDLAVPSDLRRLADARSALTLSLAGPADLPVDLRDRFYSFFEQAAGSALLKVSAGSQLLTRLTQIASLSDPSLDTPFGFDCSAWTELAGLLASESPDTTLLTRAAPSDAADPGWWLVGSFEALSRISQATEYPAEPLQQPCADEIESLHRFFEDWFMGRLADDDEEFSRLEEALAPSFAMVTPDGRSLDRATLVQSLRAAHGRYAAGESEHPFRIWTRLSRVHAMDDRFVIAEYEEWQEKDGIAKGRASSVVFERRAASKWLWHHVHETWLAEK